MSDRDRILSEGEATLQHIYEATDPDEWLRRVQASNLTPFTRAMRAEAAELGIKDAVCVFNPNRPAAPAGLASHAPDAGDRA